MSQLPHVTIIEHEAACAPGYLVEWLAPTTDLQVIRPYLGQPIPETPGDGLIVLGGSNNALADELWPWLPPTRELLAHALAQDIPSYSICLGHQLLGVAAGAELLVGAPAGPEYGPHQMHIDADESDPLFGPDAGRDIAVTMMHDDQLGTVPSGARVLAHTAATPYAAMRLGELSWSTQFHPEATASTLLGWLETTPELSAAERSELLTKYLTEMDEITNFAKQITLRWRAVL